MQLTRKLRRQSALLLTRSSKRKSGSDLMVSFLFNLFPFWVVRQPVHLLHCSRIVHKDVGFSAAEHPCHADESPQAFVITSVRLL